MQCERKYTPLSMFNLTTHEASNRWRPFMVLCGAFMVNVGMGSTHCFGNLLMYTTSYMREVGGESTRYKDTGWIFAASIIMQSIFGFQGGRMERVMGARKTLILGSLIMCAGVCFSYYTVSSFWLFFLTYGVLVGIGCGITYPVPLACAIRWMPNKKALATGIITMGRGIAICVLTPIQTYLINFKDFKPDLAPYENAPLEKYYTNPDILNRIPFVFLFLASLLFICEIFGCIVICNPPASNSDVSSESDCEKHRLSSISDRESSITLDDSMMSHDKICALPVFWSLWLMMFFCWQAVTYTQIYWKVMGAQELGFRDSVLARIGSLAALSNSCGRTFWGYVGDRSGFRWTMICMCTLTSTFLFTLNMAAKAGGWPMYCLWLCVVFSAHGGAFALFPSIVVDLFGPNNFAPVYGLLFTSRATSTLITCLLAQSLLHAIGHVGVSVIVSACSLMTLFLTLCIQKPKSETLAMA